MCVAFELSNSPNCSKKGDRLRQSSCANVPRTACLDSTTLKKECVGISYICRGLHFQTSVVAFLG